MIARGGQLLRSRGCLLIRKVAVHPYLRAEDRRNTTRALDPIEFAASLYREVPHPNVALPRSHVRTCSQVVPLRLSLPFSRQRLAAWYMQTAKWTLPPRVTKAELLFADR